MKTIPTGKIIVISGFQLGTASSHAEAIKLRDEIVADAAALAPITTAEIAEDAGVKLRALTTFAAQIEVARETAKAPVLERGRAIDALAKDLVESVNLQIKRVKPLLGTWTAEQEQKALEAQRKAQEEEDRIRREADTAEQNRLAAAEAETKRINDEANAKAAALLERANNAKSPEARDNLLSKVDDIRNAAAAATEQVAETFHATTAAQDEKTMEKVAETRHAVTLATPGKVAGISAKKKPCYEVIDIDEVYKGNPLFVKLTPADGVIKQAILKLKPGQSIPGLRCWLEADASVR